MSAIATAIIGGAVVGAIGVGVAGNEAANATQGAANTAAGVQYAALQQQAQLAAPYTQLGQSAIPTYQALLGIGPQGTAGIQNTLQQLPSYQFAKTQGIQGTEAALGAQGLSLSGNAVQALDQYGTGLAEQNYQSYLQNLLAPIQIGQGAAAGQAANIQAGATNLGNIAVNQGNTLAGIYANEAAGLNSAAGSGVNNWLTYQTLQGLGGFGGGYGYGGFAQPTPGGPAMGITSYGE